MSTQRERDSETDQYSGLDGEHAAICQIMPPGPGLLPDRVKRLVEENARLRSTLVDIAVNSERFRSQASETLWGDRSGEVTPVPEKTMKVCCAKGCSNPIQDQEEACAFHTAQLAREIERVSAEAISAEETNISAAEKRYGEQAAARLDTGSLKPSPLFRLGRKTGRTLYRLDASVVGEAHEILIGFIDERHGALVVEMLNEASEQRHKSEDRPAEAIPGPVVECGACGDSRLADRSVALRHDGTYRCDDCWANDCRVSNEGQPKCSRDDCDHGTVPEASTCYWCDRPVCGGCGAALPEDRRESAQPSVIAGNDALYERCLIVSWLRAKAEDNEGGVILEILAEQIDAGEHMLEESSSPSSCERKSEGG